MGKWCLQASSFIFDWIITKVAGDQDKWRNFYAFEYEYLWSQTVNVDQILPVASLGAGKGCIIF